MAKNKPVNDEEEIIYYKITLEITLGINSTLEEVEEEFENVQIITKTDKWNAGEIILNIEEEE